MWFGIGQIFSKAAQESKPPAVEKKLLSPELRSKLFASAPVLPNVDGPVSDYSLSSAFVVADYTSIFRDAQDLAMGVWNQFPNAPFASMKDAFSSKDMALGNHAFGSATGLNALIGTVALAQDFKEVAFAEAIGDSRGVLIGRLSMGKNASLLGTGVSYGVFRPLAMAAVIQNSSPTSLIARVSSGFSFAGTLLYTVFFAFISLALGVQVYEGVKLRNRLSKAEDLAEQVEILQGKLCGNSDSVKEKLLKKHGSEEAVNRVLIDEAYKSGKDNLRALMKELGIEKVSEERLKEVIDEALEASIQGKGAEDIQKMIEQKLNLMGLEVKTAIVDQKKHAKMKRLLGKTGLGKLGELGSMHRLADRVRLGDKEAIAKASSLVEAIKGSARRKLTENAVVMAVCIMGIAAMIAGFVFTGGIPLIVAAAFVLLFGVAMTFVDAYDLYIAYRDELPAAGDKKMLALSTAIGIASLLTMVALAFSGVVSMGIVPTVISIILIALWLGQNAATWGVMVRNERRHEKKMLEPEEILKRVRDLQLPEELQQRLEAELKNHDAKEMIDLIRKCEEAKKERLREELMPLLVKDVSRSVESGA